MKAGKMLVCTLPAKKEKEKMVHISPKSSEEEKGLTKRTRGGKEKVL